MTNFDMKRNGSGYYDETAYRGLNSMAEQGEVWKCTTNGTDLRDVLIICNHGTFCTVLGLVEDDAPDRIEIPLEFGVKYTDPRMIRYIYNQNLCRLVDRAGINFNEVLDAVHEALPYGDSIVDAYVPIKISFDEEDASDKQSIYRFCHDEIRTMFGADVLHDHFKCMYLTCLLNNDTERATYYYDLFKNGKAYEGKVK